MTLAIIRSILASVLFYFYFLPLIHWSYKRSKSIARPMMDDWKAHIIPLLILGECAPLFAFHLTPTVPITSNKHSKLLKILH